MTQEVQDGFFSKRLSSASSYSEDETHPNKKGSQRKKKVKVPWNVSENIEISNNPKTFAYFSKNALRHVFNLLDSKDKCNGLLAKTRLQVICSAICLAYSLNHNADELSEYNGQKTELTFDELISYLETIVLSKIDPKNFDIVKLERTAWAIISKEGNDSQRFQDDDLFVLWRIFNKLTYDSISIDIEEAALFLENYMKAIGNVWHSEPLNEYTKETKLKFWDLIDCLETEYIDGTPSSVFLEGLETLKKKYLQEVIKVGYLNKKGHRVKSIKSRWFILTPHLLSYYETTSIKSKKGDVVINSDSTVENISDSKTGKCRFSVTCGASGKIYELEAPDQRTKNEWISVFKQCIGIDDDITPLMVELSKRADKRVEKLRRQSTIEAERLEREEFLRNQQSELESVRMALDHATIQAETEAALKDEERKRREELELLKVEYEKLLEEEKLAREMEKQARARQQEILSDETAKRLELERIKAEQDGILEAERKMREGLEEISKEQSKVLEEERERLKLLDEAYKSASAEVAAAHAKLEASENESRVAALRVEEAKERTRMITTAGGLSKGIALSQIRPITHRGAGAFTNEDFTKTPLYLKNEEVPVPVNRSEIADEERSQILETNLVRPSEFSKNLNESNS